MPLRQSGFDWIAEEELGTLAERAVGVLDPDEERVAGTAQRQGERDRLGRFGEDDVGRVVDPDNAGEKDVAAVLAAQRQPVVGLSRRGAGVSGARRAIEEARADFEAAEPEKRPVDGLAEGEEVGITVVGDYGERVVPLGMAEDEPGAARNAPLSAVDPHVPEPLAAHHQAELARSGGGLYPEDRRCGVGAIVDVEERPLLPKTDASRRKEPDRRRQGVADRGRGRDTRPDEGCHRKLGAGAVIAGAARGQRLEDDSHWVAGAVEAEAFEADTRRAVGTDLDGAEDGLVADVRPDHPLRPADVRVDREMKPPVGGVERARLVAAENRGLDPERAADRAQELERRTRCAAFRVEGQDVVSLGLEAVMNLRRRFSGVGRASGLRKRGCGGLRGSGGIARNP